MESPKSYLVIFNINSKKNIGNLIRSASAMGVTEIFAVGRHDYNTFGAHGAQKHIKITTFATLAELREYLDTLGIPICGIEIMPEVRKTVSI